MHICPFLIALVAEDLLDRLRVDAVLGQDRGALAAQLERHRHELLGGGLGDLATDRRTPGVEEVIPADAREGAGELEPSDDDVDAVAIEGRADHLLQQLGARRACTPTA